MKSFNTLGASSLVLSRLQKGFHYNMFKQGVPSMFSCRYYSTSNSYSELRDLPFPLLTINNLNNKVSIKSNRNLLKDKGPLAAAGRWVALRPKVFILLSI
uniref:Uncharacterized protein n=1 Tax=Juglanconis sp. TaxID=2041886 RepID=A0A291LID6_9PEZI|nr:hypothetical protein [Juglanconis sp.]